MLKQVCFHKWDWWLINWTTINIKLYWATRLTDVSKAILTPFGRVIESKSQFCLVQHNQVMKMDEKDRYLEVENLEKVKKWTVPHSASYRNHPKRMKLKQRHWNLQILRLQASYNACGPWEVWGDWQAHWYISSFHWIKGKIKSSRKFRILKNYKLYLWKQPRHVT